MRVLKAGTKAVLQMPVFMQTPATQGRPRGFGGAGCFSSISWLQLCNAENCQPQLGLSNSNKGQGSKCFPLGLQRFLLLRIFLTNTTLRSGKNGENIIR